MKANEARLAYLAALDTQLGDAFRSIRVFDPHWRSKAKEILQGLHDAQDQEKKK